MKHVTPETSHQIGERAAALSMDIYLHFNQVDATLKRNEELVHRQWLRKTEAQRRKVLLYCWPYPMPEHHRPDIESHLNKEVRRRVLADMRVAACFHTVSPASTSVVVQR
jgi:hypothetical protein